MLNLEWEPQEGLGYWYLGSVECFEIWIDILGSAHKDWPADSSIILRLVKEQGTAIEDPCPPNSEVYKNPLNPSPQTSLISYTSSEGSSKN